MTSAVQAISRGIRAGHLCPGEVDVALIERCLHTAECPPVMSKPAISRCQFHAFNWNVTVWRWFGMSDKTRLIGVLKRVLARVQLLGSAEGNIEISTSGAPSSA
eukprot:scaffold648213_cov50-Prasinocladus_malaysianus.AAC.1